MLLPGPEALQRDDIAGRIPQTDTGACVSSCMQALTVEPLTGENGMTHHKPKSVIKRVYVPTQVHDLPNGERLTIPGHYVPDHPRVPSSDDADS